jgi:hypothetical protein
MDILKSLLANLGRKWSQQAVEIPLIKIEKNLGTHTHATIEVGNLYFHSYTFHANIPQKQTIVLDNLTVDELLTTIASMGYSATLTSEAGDIETADLKAFILMEGRDFQLDITLKAFTSTNWKMLYPIYRLLKQTEGDLEKAVNQMYITTSRSSWLDYWSTFLGIRRLAGEPDNQFVRRMLMRLFNPKTNNVAMGELIGFQLNSTVEIKDLEALLFEVNIDTDYVNDSADVRELLDEIKAAGVAYLLHFTKTFFEDYPLYIADKTGKALKNQDEGSASVVFTEAAYGWESQEDALITNETELNSSSIGVAYKVAEAGSMSMTQNGIEVQSSQW